MKSKNSLWKEERGQFTYVLLFIIIFTMLLFAFAIVIPILEALMIGFYSGTSNAITPIINLQVSAINDVNLKTDINAAVVAQNNMQISTVQLFTILCTYAGIITIVVVFVAWLLIGRKNVESGGLA